MIVDNGRSRLLGGKYEDILSSSVAAPASTSARSTARRRARLRRGLHGPIGAVPSRCSTASSATLTCPSPEPVRRLQRGLLGAHRWRGSSASCARTSSRPASRRGRGGRPASPSLTRRPRGGRASRPWSCRCCVLCPSRPLLRGDGPLAPGRRRGTFRGAAVQLPGGLECLDRPTFQTPIGWMRRERASGNVEREAFLPPEGGARGGRRARRGDPAAGEGAAQAPPHRRPPPPPKAPPSSPRPRFDRRPTALFVERLGRAWRRGRGGRHQRSPRGAGASRGVRGWPSVAAAPGLAWPSAACAGRPMRAMPHWPLRGRRAVAETGVVVVCSSVEVRRGYRLVPPAAAFFVPVRGSSPVWRRAARPARRRAGPAQRGGFSAVRAARRTSPGLRRRRARARRGVRLGARRGVGWTDSDHRWPGWPPPCESPTDCGSSRRPASAKARPPFSICAHRGLAEQGRGADLGMSYNKAWNTLHAAEQRPALRCSTARRRRARGGSQASASRRGAAAPLPVALRADVERDLECLYDKHFSDWPAEPSAGDAPRGGGCGPGEGR